MPLDKNLASEEIKKTLLLQSVEHLRYYAGWADKIFGKVAPTAGEFQAIVYKEPLGELLSPSHIDSCLTQPS